MLQQNLISTTKNDRFKPLNTWSFPVFLQTNFFSPNLRPYTDQTMSLWCSALYKAYCVRRSSAKFIQLLTFKTCLNNFCSCCSYEALCVKIWIVSKSHGGKMFSQILQISFSLNGLWRMLIKNTKQKKVVKKQMKYLFVRYNLNHEFDSICVWSRRESASSWVRLDLLHQHMSSGSNKVSVF